MSGSAKSDFVAAEEIKVILHGREAAEQERILRWVFESLGLAKRADVSATAARLTPGAAEPEPRIDIAAAPKGPAVVDIKTFVAEKAPKSDMQFAATVAYYHHFIDTGKRSSITKADLQAATRLAGWKRFSNPKKPLDNAVANGYLDRAGRGEYKLNAVGENLVAMALPGGKTEAAGGPSNGRKRRAKSKSKRTTKAR